MARSKHSLKWPSLFYRGSFIRFNGISNGFLSTVEGFSIPSILLGASPREIHFHCFASVLKSEDSFSSAFGIVVLGLQLFPVCWSGIVEEGDEHLPHHANMVAIQRVFDIIESEDLLSETRAVSRFKIRTCSHSIRILGRSKQKLSSNPVTSALQIKVGDEINAFNSSNNFKLFLEHDCETPWHKFAKFLVGRALKGNLVTRYFYRSVPFSLYTDNEIESHLDGL